jgi:hypothetical protein
MSLSGNVFDTLCHQLAKLLTFKPGERDLVMLQHKFVIEWKDGKRVSACSSHSDENTSCVTILMNAAARKL